jgi:hypothetical protein
LIEVEKSQKPKSHCTNVASLRAAAVQCSRRQTASLFFLRRIHGAATHN